MISTIQSFQNSDVAASSMQVEEEQKFQWNEETTNIFNSACFALIYLNGGKIELAKERVTHGNATCPIYPKALKYIIERGNFPGVRTLSTKVLGARCYMLRQKSKNSGLIWEQELLKQYQTLQATNTVNDAGEEISALLGELNKFGIKPDEYDQWLPRLSFETPFKWDEEREAIFKSACFALIYLNGGRLELSKERFSHGTQKNLISHTTIEHILEKGNFPAFTIFPKNNIIKEHIRQLKQKSKKNGAIWEEELFKQYQELEAKTIVNAEGEEIPALWQELGKFGIEPEEYDQWLSMENCFKWNEKREEIFISACLALIYLNGGQVELKKERATKGALKSALSSQAIEYIIQRGNFPEFQAFPKGAVVNHLSRLKKESKKKGSTLEEELQEKYQDLQATTIVNAEGREIQALWQELNKFEIQPEEYDQWVPIESCFTWDEERNATFTSACIALLYLNGGKTELAKERMSIGNTDSPFSAKAIRHILERGNFPVFKTLSEKSLSSHLTRLRKKSKEKGELWEEELLRQYQELEATTIVNAEGREIQALWQELNKFGIQPEEYDQWVSIASGFTWDEERNALITSACLALLYLNGGKIELAKERMSIGGTESPFSAKTIRHILERGNFPALKTLSENSLSSHLARLKKKGRERGELWEEGLLRQYQDLQAKTITSTEGMEIPELWQELNKFGIKPEEYDQWVPIANGLTWNAEREAILNSACLTLIYLNGGKLELSQENMIGKSTKVILSARAITNILERANFPVSKKFSEKSVSCHLTKLRKKSKETGELWEEGQLKQYKELEGKMVVNDTGEEIPAIWLELSKFGIDPAEHDISIAIEPSSRTNPRKRLAEESPEPEAEPAKKRGNYSSVSSPQSNQIFSLKQVIADIRADVMNE